jgi:hypothetical protein
MGTVAPLDSLTQVEGLCADCFHRRQRVGLTVRIRACLSALDQVIWRADARQLDALAAELERRRRAVLGRLAPRAAEPPATGTARR